MKRSPESNTPECDVPEYDIAGRRPSSEERWGCIRGLPCFPRRIQIQTTTACGADCTICPHPELSPRWSNGRMTEELFERIVRELEGRPVEYVAPYLMADPLADRYIFDRVRRLREALPEAAIEVSTTGKYLARSIAEKLVEAPLTDLRISSHGLSTEEYARTMPGVDFDRALRNIHEFVDLWKQRGRPYRLAVVCLWGVWPREREQEIETHWRELGVELSQWRVVSRAGRVDLGAFPDGSPDPTGWGVSGPDHEPHLCRQHRDTEWLHILSDGRVTLCCMDYGQEVIIGNLREETIEALWLGAAFQRIRAGVRDGAESSTPLLCRHCEWHVTEERYREENRSRVPRVKRGVEEESWTTQA